MTEPQNPLLLPVVFDVLVKHVPNGMWKTCRLVCKSWYNELLHSWRKRTVYIDGTNSHFQLPEFLETYQPYDFRQLEKVPFRSLHVKQLTIGDETNLQVEYRFWSLCGPGLHSLYFDLVTFQDLELLKNIIFRLTPTLQKLKIGRCTMPETVQNVDNNQTNYPLENVYPNLKILKIMLIEPTVANKPFPLNFLNLFSNSQVQTSSDFAQLLSKYSALTKISLTNLYKWKLPLTQCSLKLLPQTLSDLTLNHFGLDDWSFLAFTPNLTKLKMVEVLTITPKPQQFPHDKFPLLQFLTTFSYQLNYGVMPPQTVELITQMMPNVKNLILSVDYAGFEMICNAWAQLSHWKIPYASLSDKEVFYANRYRFQNLNLEMNKEEKWRPEISFRDEDPYGFEIMRKVQMFCSDYSLAEREDLLNIFYGNKVEDF